MFLAVWMLYAGDRLLDARPLADGSTPLDLEERHRFHHRYRRAFLAVIAPAALTLGWLLHELDPAALRLYATLATLLAAWLLLVHARPTPQALRLPKELAVGIFFSAAVYIPTVARAPGLRLVLLPDALLTAAVCTLNCLFLYAWEHPETAAASQPTCDRTHPSTLWAVRHLPQLCAAVAGAAALTLAATWPWRQALPAEPALAAALAVAVLFALHGLRQRLSPVHLRAAADLALLTPILFFL